MVTNFSTALSGVTQGTGANGTTTMAINPDIIGDASSDKRWRQDFERRQFERMALTSLRHMPNCDFHIIKGDKLGGVLIAPESGGYRLVRHIEAHPTSMNSQQPGAGDILVAALAMEFAALKNDGDTAGAMLRALEKSLGVVACYMQMDWQEVPSQREISRFSLHSMVITEQFKVPESILLLPEENQIDLRKLSLYESRLVSTDKVFREKVEEVVKFLLEGWENREAGSAIVTGRGGVGKSDLTKVLRRLLGDQKILVLEDRDFEFAREKCPNARAAVAQFEEKLINAGKDARGMLVIIDEAFSKIAHLLYHEEGKMLIQLSADCNPPVRFLFADADLKRHKEHLSESQFLTRCKLIFLPDLSTRQGDIPFIFAASCLFHLGLRSAKITESVLLAVINWVLSLPEGQQNAREIFKKAKQIVGAFLNRTSGKDDPLPAISRRDLPEELAIGLDAAASPKRFFDFSW